MDGKRISEGRIRDCHGDLHSGQIFLTDGVHILDCIEFNKRFRYCDVASDIAFLAMDLDSFGRPDLSWHLMVRYLAEAHDDDVRQVLDFYKCYRAYVRGKVTSFRLDEPGLPEKERAESIFAARRYFHLAHSYAVNNRRPTLFISFGLVGTGKSTIAEGLRRMTGAALVASDLVRKRLAGVPVTERHLEAPNQGIYLPEFTRRTYDELFRQAESWLRVGRSVILDASFAKATERGTARQLARKVNADFVLVECQSNENVLRRRLEERAARGDSPSDGRWEIYLAQKQSVDQVSEPMSLQHWTIDNSGSLDDTTRQIQTKLEEVWN